MEHKDYRNIKSNAAAKKFFRGKPISIVNQSQMLIQTIPNSHAKIISSTMFWTGTVQPNAISCKYKILLEYEIASFPKVTVIDPPLQRRNDNEPIPHMYEQERLCLYFPLANEWNNTKSLHKTILPWAVLWLMYYEYWHVTGIWQGGGIHIHEEEIEPNHNF
ncbi:hypothetical protein [Paenibacillus sp. S150]|uniref:hypothetical protein n=1 Tax=Paenibacillus sp. S150 TaxID=2749826 RepID=UPI001C561769|nr:hypothetical protein [Paenibacillus sp. S150]MBW4079994.1 hypothetical protein [Paenibacillus sp. S150]